MSIEYQAMFWLRNVCESDLKAIQQKNNVDNSMVDGLRELSSLLRNIYSDYRSFEISTAERVPTKIGIMADDLENYHNLTETIDCLYGIAKGGILQVDGMDSYLIVQKDVFKKEFKKSISFPFEILEKHSFYFRYLKNGKEVSSYKLCDTFNVYYDNSNFLISSMKYFVQNITEKNVKEDYAQTNILFYIADYDSALLNKTTRRKEMCPHRYGISKTLGTQGELWSFIMSTLCDQLKMNYDISLNPYVFPGWNFKFLNKKKTVCTFNIGVDRLFVRLPLSYELAKELIMTRDKLPQIIRECIERFGCVRCGKCTNESNIEIVDEIRLCKLNYSNFVTEDSRLIAAELTTKDETELIIRLIKELIHRF
ncbi:hypothetical protein [Anaerocolumna aminovalerica]|uniref:hypothetical protein n=1 Tax=Anaerocolumna aminovalerica TaxID=1527 RepID=UPI00248C1137|nr:hypothetical protein [Anaerocolumna aminovalerica]